MDWNHLFSKINYKCARIYTRLLRKSFHCCGEKTIVFFPNRFFNPSGLTLKNNVTLFSSSWYNIIREESGQQYNGSISIGNNTTIGSFVQLSAARNITIGDNVGISKGTTIVDHLHDYTYIGKPIIYSPLSPPKPIIVEDDAFIGANCILAPGTHVGRHVFVGANSVVTGKIPDFTMIAGNPATIIRRYNEKTNEWARV